MTRHRSATTQSQATGATGIASIESGTALNANISRRKRRCIRLDFAHHRNIFVTTFYRIWMYRRRHVMRSLLQLLVPPLMLILLVVYLGELINIQDHGWTRFSRVSEQELYNKMCRNPCSPSRTGVLTCFIKHDTIFAQKLKAELKQRLSISNIELKIVNEKDDIAREALHYHMRGEAERYIGGIAIYNPPINPPEGRAFNGVGPDFKLNFTVLTAQKVPEFAFELSSSFFSLEKNEPEQYYQLLGIELTVYKAFHHLILNEESAVEKIEKINVQSLPYPPHGSYTVRDPKSAGIEEDIAAMLVTMFVLSMIPVFFTVIEGPVTEKENGFKLYLMLMGYPRGAYWFYWILNQMMIQIVVAGLQTWMLLSEIHPNTGSLVKQGDWSLWFVVLILYNLCALSCFTFLAAFFRRGKMATYLGILIWLLSFHLMEARVPAYSSNSELAAFLLTCLLPSGCLHWSVVILTAITSESWDTSLTLPLSNTSHFTLVDVMAMMIGDFFIYFVLTLYVDNLFPGPLEYSQPWNYFFEGIRCRYIDPNRFIPRSSTASQLVNRDEVQEPASFEAIVFRDISKKFYLIDGVYGIDKVKFTAYTSKITVLLGHSDSGRTTLMRLVCGEYAPTQGTIDVFGYNVRKELQRVQSFLSVCMEKNLLCEYLTVMEHMHLIGRLKGLTRKETKRKSKTILESVGLLSQADYDMSKLVRWQRRVLCVAMALLGSVPILLLDEPTKDLDLDVKRQIWSLLKELKKRGKTILMSTQCIDEAYEVADRIVIMSRGRVAGVGTPSRLESLFETGYHLHLNCVPNSNKDEILTFLQNEIPSIHECEGSLRKVKKAIRIADWDKSGSQSNLMELSSRGEPSTVVNIVEDTFSEQHFAPPLRVDPKLADSQPTILQMQSSTINYTHNSIGENTVLGYVLPFRERENFPKVFKALENVASTVQLGIKSYEFHLYDMERAFDEVDDFVDVLDAARSTMDIELGDFLDIKALRVPVDDPVCIRLPGGNSQKKYHQRVCSVFVNVWALVVKRTWYLIVNYKHGITQIIAPIIILIVSVQSTNVYFHHDLWSDLINYNVSTKYSTSVVPYRFIEGPEASGLRNSFVNVFTRPQHKISSVQNIGNDTFDKYYNAINRHKLHNEVIIGADFTQVDTPMKAVTAMFSPGYRHSAPLALLVMFNSILDYEFPSSRYRVEMSAQLLSPETEHIFLLNSTLLEHLAKNSVDITITVAVAFGYFIFSSGCVTQPCAEAISRLKRYQTNALQWNGLYWVGCAVIDLMMSVVVIGSLTAVLCHQAGHGAFLEPKFLIYFLLTLTLGGFASIFSSYSWSNYLISTSTSYYAALSINQFLGLFTFLLFTIINFEYFGPFVGTIVELLLQMIQPFTIPYNVYQAVLLALNNSRCEVLHQMAKTEMCSKDADNYKNIATFRKECCDVNADTSCWNFQFLWTDSQLWINIVILFVHCIVGVLYLSFAERRRMRRSLFHLWSTQATSPPPKDQKDEKSILNEEMFVAQTQTKAKDHNDDKDEAFIVEKLSTTSGRRVLLQDITFAAEPGKCTTIVGPETSGITVLYEILSGIRAISEGKVAYGEYSLFSWSTRQKYLYQVGFCPSNDITVDKLSGLQLLKLFGRLRGIPSKDLRTHVDHWVKTFVLQNVIKKPCQSYSAVIRKKLAVAMACIGNPPVVIFDDPTSGLDPLSKAQVCGVIEKLVWTNRVVIVLTHDVSSIQWDCYKLIFLVNGQMQYCENPDKLALEIAHEFTLIIKLKADGTERVDFETYTEFKSQLEKEIEEMLLFDEQSYCLKYRIQSKKYDWLTLFEVVEKNIKSYRFIDDYFIRKTSLEDVYHSYAVKQRVIRKADSVWDQFRSTYC